MNFKVLAILIVLFIVLPSLSQIDTTSLNFYPLHDHNYWQYLEYSWELWTPNSWISYYSIEVLGDTVLANGKKYKILERVNLDSIQSKYKYFERIDTLTCNVYAYDAWSSGQEVLLDSLKSQPGDTSNANRFLYGVGSFCDSLYTDTILSTPTVSKRIILLAPLNYQHHILSQGFGFVAYYSTYDFGYTTINLKYAVIEGNEFGQPVSIPLDSRPELIKSIILYPNYPNPFNPVTNIEFYLDKAQEVELSIYSIDGRLVDQLVSAKLPAGKHWYVWNASGKASGVYIYQLKVGERIFRKKCILMK